MIVLIPSCSEHGGYPGNLMKVEISDLCPQCGRKRGVDLWGGLSYDGSRRLNVDCWRNECDHIDSYNSVREGVASGVNKQVAWGIATTRVQRQLDALPPPKSKKIRLSSAQIHVLEMLAKHPNGFIRKTNHNDLQEVIHDGTTTLYFKGQTLNFLIKHAIVVPMEDKPKCFKLDPKFDLTPLKNLCNQTT